MAPRRTALFEQHRAAGGRLVDFAGWEMPQQYSSVKAEQRAVREGAGLFDVSHMGRFELVGEGAASFLQSVVTNDLSRLEPNRSQYNLLCQEDGGILDDLVVYRTPRRWLVVVNAPNRERDANWLKERAPAGVHLVDRSEELALLALQGPLAQDQLPAEGVDLDAILYFGSAEGKVAGVRMLISRTGYTGEDGFELFAPAESAAAVWHALLEAGAQPCGLACRDVCRLEAGLRLYGNDMDRTVNPYEAGLGWTVKLEKGEFVGRSALAEVKARGPKRRIAGLRAGPRTIPRHGAILSRAEEPIGEVTSGTHSFWLDAGIGLGLVRPECAEPGGRLSFESRGAEASAEVTSLPFYRGSAGKPPRDRAAVTVTSDSPSGQ